VTSFDLTLSAGTCSIELDHAIGFPHHGPNYRRGNEEATSALNERLARLRLAIASAIV
jgi:hypothetical protein